MKIALLGYGKMGKEIEKIALERGHEIVVKVDIESDWTKAKALLATADVAIEFSTPQSTIQNIFHSFDVNVPVVVGTTGWMEQLDHVKEVCEKNNRTLFYASNFSIGVNLFFEINNKLALMMKKQNGYNVTMEEIHHTEKLDSPSGTAIKLAEGIIEKYGRKKSWVNNATNDSEVLGIVSKRIDKVPGTHTVTWSSEIDDIELKHTAHNRKGFALGAVMAAEWVKDKSGVFTMHDMLSFMMK
ncbi:MAG: 4-hydroxy-tetrahydrodipicolinate reductase [Bacteroidia bacterium]|nr:4-hydroxy-tetrahydrodipicolinate reductase [Bacteroidia bacterium]